MTTMWLDRTLTQCAYYYCLCLSEKAFLAEIKRLDVPIGSVGAWIDSDMHARLHHFILRKKPVAIVCLDRELAKDKTGPQVAALLVHEAVHIWQRHASFIGSFNDHGDEEEAYAIQNIAQALLEDYARQTI